ncbi:L-aspartate oxidase [Cohaesibacter marisflavi]|uniref:L-aspartate oxidase n=1 Tax=Cohaesibacter marisflavi TaxID=655353 RepID=A0A1I5E5X3_9HYPH|nr:L-aspartate oxidase [Cohaesibacter marisflavi]SFO06948.1 L-aspartate oxidase [Cohaesibacter marisflavi]
MNISASDDFRPESWQRHDEIIIVGGGLAGLFCAYKLAPRPVTLISAAPIGEGASSVWAQGGIAAAVSEGDSTASHLRDTIKAGAGIVDEKIARLMTNQGPQRILDLLEVGVPFDKDLEGKLRLSREAAHSASRVVRVSGDKAGFAIMEALIRRVIDMPSIRIVSGYQAEKLHMEGRYVKGIIARRCGQGADTDTHTLFFPARAVVLASGGSGNLYRVTTNPTESNGDGIAMAAVAGAVIADPEFVQFHPTALDVGKDPAPLATEALRGHDAKLINKAGERFMLGEHELAELAPRDIVARAIHRQVEEGKGAFLDCREAIGDSFSEEFPTVYGHAQEAGIDPATEPLPVAPAAHYHMGGILTDAQGRTTLDGLWAAGEVTATGAHGANRLASNSLLEAVVFASLVAQDINQQLSSPKHELWQPIRNERTLPALHQPQEDIARLRATMSRYVGVERDGAGLKAALQIIAELEQKSVTDSFRNQLTTSKLITVAAYLRKESRGGHFRKDSPHQQEDWRHRTFITLKQAEAEMARILSAAEPD